MIATSCLVFLTSLSTVLVLGLDLWSTAPVLGSGQFFTKVVFCFSSLLSSLLPSEFNDNGQEETKESLVSQTSGQQEDEEGPEP